MIFKHKKRTGFSLIEMVVAIGVGSAMMGIAVGAMYLLLRVDQQSRAELRRRAGLSRLAEQFREDGRAAVGFGRVAPPPGEDEAPPVWEFQTPEGHVVQYARSQEGLFRTERAGGDLLGQESFALAPNARVSVEQVDEAGIRLVSLRIVSEGGLPEDPHAPSARIDAAFGSDHRFEPSEEP